MKLRNKVALVTGGSRGVGLAISRRMAQEGVSLFLVSRTEAELEREAKWIHDHTDAQVRWMAGDVGAEGFVVEQLAGVS